MALPDTLKYALKLLQGIKIWFCLVPACRNFGPTSPSLAAIVAFKAAVPLRTRSFPSHGKYSNSISNCLSDRSQCFNILPFLLTGMNQQHLCACAILHTFSRYLWGCCLKTVQQARWSDYIWPVSQHGKWFLNTFLATLHWGYSWE